MRLHISLSVIVIIIFSALSIILYRNQVGKKYKEINQLTSSQLKDLAYIVESFSLQNEIKTVDEGKIAIEELKQKIFDYSLTDSSFQSGKIDTLIDSMLMKRKPFKIDSVQLLSKLSSLKKYVAQKKYFQNGFAFVIDRNGLILIHPDSEGKDISKTDLFKMMQSSVTAENHFTYRWPNEDGVEKWMFVEYLPKVNQYVAITFETHEILTGMDSFIWISLLVALLALVFFNLAIVYVNAEFNRMINQLVEKIRSMAQGHFVSKIDYLRNNEIGKIVQSLNVLIEGLRATAEFSKEIGKGNLVADFTPLSSEDVLGTSLLEMRKSLIQAKEDEIVRKIEDDKQKWATNGLAKFADILRLDNDNMDKFAYNVLSNAVKYLEANQGCIFVINDDDHHDLHFELKAAFAYDKRKFISKRIDPGEGIAGRCAIEKETIYLIEVPEDYVTITSGLGESLPRCLLVVPLKMNDQIYGIMEIASFKEIETYQIQFVEKIAENIASTVASVRINIQTTKLLKESEKQSKRLEQQEEEMRQNLEELQATQEEAARNEEAALGFVNSVNHTIIRADFNNDGTLEYGNTKFLDIMGYSLSEVEKQHYSMFVQERDRTEFNESWKILISGGKHYEQEVEYKTKYGKIWLLATYTPVRDRKGKVTKILFLAIDISKEKKKSIAFENDIKAIELSIYKAEYKPDGAIISYNDVLIKSLELGKHDLDEKSIYDFIEPSAINNFKILWNQVLNGIPSEEERFLLTKSGKEKWFKGTYTGVADLNGNIYKVIYIANEVTEQKHLEEETTRSNHELREQGDQLRKNMEELGQIHVNLEQQEAELKGLLSAIDNSTYVLELTLEGQIKSANSTFLNAFHLNQTEIVGRNDREFVDVSNKQLMEEYEHFWDELRFGIIKRKISNMRIKDKDIWLQDTYTPIYDQNRKPYKILRLSMDITKTKMLEIEAKQHSSELQEQKEELRQNIEELQTTQEEMLRLKEVDEIRSKEMMETIESYGKMLMKVIDNVPGRIFLKNAKGAYLLANSAVAKLYNRNLDQIIGKNDYELVDEYIARSSREKDLAIMASGQQTYFDTETLGKDSLIFQTTKMPFYIDHIKETGLLGIQIDVTEHKQMEDEIKKQNHALLTREEELKQNLEELKTTQEEILRMKEQDEQKTREMMVAIEDHRQTLFNIIDQIPGKIFLKDNNCKMLMVNKQVAITHGCTPQDLIGKSDFDFFDAEKAQALVNEEKQIMSTVPKTFIQKETLSGDEKTLKTTKMPFYIPYLKVTGLLGVQWDISDVVKMEEAAKRQAQELKEKEEELMQNLEEIKTTQEELERKNLEQKELTQILEKEVYLMKCLLENSSDAIYFKDLESKFIRVTSSMAKNFGVQKVEDIYGKSDFDFFATEHSQQAYNDEQLIIRTGKPILDLVEKEVWEDGRVTWVSTIKMPLRDLQGKIVGTFGISRDITEIKSMEFEIKQRNEELMAHEEELRQNLEELQAIQEQLEQAKISDEERYKEMLKRLDLQRRTMIEVLNQLPAKIFLKDESGSLVLLNSAVAAVYSKTVEELIGTSDFENHPYEDAKQYREQELKIMKLGKQTYIQEEAITGELKLLRTTKLPFYIAHLEQTGLLGFQFDVTNEVMNERKLKELEPVVLELERLKNALKR